MMYARFWRVPAYLPYLQPALTPDAIAGAEATLGVTLPATYLDLLRVQNGGYARLTLPDTIHSGFSGIGPWFPNITKESWWSDDTEDHWRPRDGHLVIPFDGDGHWSLCFDYRQRGPRAEPHVTAIDLEEEEDELIAGDFRAFLELLEEDIQPGTLGIKDDLELNAAAKALETALGARFEPPDSWAHGYPECRCQLAEDAPVWLWLSPNRVARGFVRPDDDRYDELVDVMPGTALRMPDHPDTALILAASEGAIDRAREACLRAGFSIVELA